MKLFHLTQNTQDTYKITLIRTSGNQLKLRITSQTEHLSDVLLPKIKVTKIITELPMPTFVQKLPNLQHEKS